MGYLLVYAGTYPDGDNRLEHCEVEDAGHAADVLMNEGIYPWKALLIDGKPVATVCVNTNPLWLEFNKRHHRAREEAEYQEYLRLKAIYEPDEEG